MAVPESVAVGVSVGVADGDPVGLDVFVGVGVAGTVLGVTDGPVWDGADTCAPVALGLGQAVAVVTGSAEETTCAILALGSACADTVAVAAGVHPDVVVGPGDAELRAPPGPVVAEL